VLFGLSIVRRSSGSFDFVTRIDVRPTGFTI
jgi:hypothetical protein